MMRTLQALIVDAERHSRRHLKTVLSRDPEVNLAGEFETPGDARDLIIERQPHLIFLDVRMGETDGFSFLESLGPHRPPFVVFATACDRCAVRAFEFQALDYLLKPLEEERIAESVNRAKAKLALNQAQARVSHRTRLAVKSGESLILLRTDQVDWIEAADNYVELHCGGETHLLRETMSALLKTLDPAKFLRIHRSAIVNLDRVKSLQPWFRGDYRVVLSSGAELTMSRSYRQGLQERVLNL